MIGQEKTDAILNSKLPEQLLDITIAIEKATAVYPGMREENKNEYFIYFEGQLYLSLFGAILLGSGLFSQELVGNQPMALNLLNERYPCLGDFQTIHPKTGKKDILSQILCSLEDRYQYSFEQIGSWLKSEINRLFEDDQPKDGYEVIATQSITWKYTVKADSLEEARQIALETSEANFIKLEDGEREIISITLLENN